MNRHIHMSTSRFPISHTGDSVMSAPYEQSGVSFGQPRYLRPFHADSQDITGTNICDLGRPVREAVLSRALWAKRSARFCGELEGDRVLLDVCVVPALGLTLYTVMATHNERPIECSISRQLETDLWGSHMTHSVKVSRSVRSN